MNIYNTKARIIYEVLMILEKKFPYPYFLNNKDQYNIEIVKIIHNEMKIRILELSKIAYNDKASILVGKIIEILISFDYDSRFTTYHFNYLLLQVMNNIPAIRIARPCYCISLYVSSYSSYSAMYIKTKHKTDCCIRRSSEYICMGNDEKSINYSNSIYLDYESIIPKSDINDIGKLLEISNPYIMLDAKKKLYNLSSIQDYRNNIELVATILDEIHLIKYGVTKLYAHHVDKSTYSTKRIESILRELITTQEANMILKELNINSNYAINSLATKINSIINNKV